MSVTGKVTVQAEAIIWPGLKLDPWPDELTKFFGQDNPLSLMQATWVGGADGHYTTKIKSFGLWVPLPDNWWIVRSPYSAAGKFAYSVVDPAQFSTLWKQVP